ncbi:MAG: hypothetical protein AAB263_15805 [Planctomycetota bacterium]
MALAAEGSWELASYGRLARALTYRRTTQNYRFNRLEDLLAADPSYQPGGWIRPLGCIPFYAKPHYPMPGMSGWPIPEATIEGQRNTAESDIAVVKAADATQQGYRIAPLTQVEIELLRPLLSFLVPGQGRSGLIDYGTVVERSPFSTWGGVTTDNLSPSSLKVGSALINGNSWVMHTPTVPTNPLIATRGIGDDWARDTALAIDAIPALNVNAVPSTSNMTALFSDQGAAALKTMGWSDDPVSAPITSVGALPLLRWLDPRTGDGATSFERPPLGLGGFGIVAIEGGATALDPVGQAQAQRRRRVVMQTVPQERPLEVSWTTQGDFEALLRSRHGSWVIAGPLPTNRISDWGSDATSGKTDMAALDRAGWLEPAPLGSFGENPSVSFDWWVPMGLTQQLPNPAWNLATVHKTTWAEVLSACVARPSTVGVAPSVAPVVTTNLTPTDLQPNAIGAPGRLGAQGLTIRAGDALAYQTGAANTPLRMSRGPGSDEIDARHLSLRFCLPAVPATPVVLLEARAKEFGHDTTAATIPGDPTFGVPKEYTDDQSVFRVHYDPANQMLVMVIANAALPWSDADRTRFGVNAWTTATDKPDDVYDKRCEPGAAALPFAPAWQAQRVEFRYKVAGGLTAGTWHQLQVFCAADRPGFHGLILDGIVGRDAIDAQDFSKTGDHYTWPSMRLDAAVPGVNDFASISGNAHLSAPNTLTVKTPPKPPGGIGMYDVSDVLPAHGIVRIDDEFFSYDGLGGLSLLTGVQRARRVDTNQGATVGGTVPANEWQCWPLTQEHFVGTLVTPGWSQFDLTGGPWLRGGVKLVAGDAADVTNAGLSHLPPLGTFNTSTLAVGVPPGTPITPATIDILPIAYAPDVAISPWAERGFVEFRHKDDKAVTGRCYFERLGNTLSLSGWSGNVPDSFSARDMEAVQISLRVDATVMTAGHFAATGALQLLDSASGRCEWVRYTSRVDQPGTDAVPGYYFLHTNGGFYRDAAATPAPGSDRRGSQRTPWRTVADGPWPAGTLVLPVQTGFSAVASHLESGDVITVVPKTTLIPGASGTPPVQVLVRHACRDGHPAALPGDAQWDTVNSWFALTHQAPVATALPDPSTAAQTVLIGRGWAGDDLGITTNVSTRRGQLPRRRALADAADSEGARLYIGSPAPNSPYAGATVIVDDLCAGALYNSGDTNQFADTAVTDFGGALNITNSANDLPVTITVSSAVFSHNQLYGLASVDGEVFAYRKVDGSHATLIARALLGSQARAHDVSGTVRVPQTVAGVLTSAVRPVSTGVPIVLLPMGPVAELCSPLAATDHAVGIDVVEIAFGNYYVDPTDYVQQYQGSRAGDPRRIMYSPFVCVHHPSDGATSEVLRLLNRPASSQRITARWIRGLYNTTAQSWTAPYTPAAHNAAWSDAPPPVSPIAAQPAGSGLNPIVIGWWPRFAPSMPASPAPEVLRSRSFAWAGFPLRFSGARFDPTLAVWTNATANPLGGVANIHLEKAAGTSVRALALAAGDGAQYLFDWDQALPFAQAVSFGDNAYTTPSSPFDWSRFTKREVDGAELRVLWTNPAAVGTGIFAASAVQGLAPRIGASDGEVGVAPTPTAGVHLRCVAPTRVLAVEDVR